MSLSKCILGTSPFVSIIMPVRNEARFVAETLSQLVCQDYPPERYEIIVADGMSDDGTQDIVRDLAEVHPQIRLLENPARLSSVGRNIGFRNGKGDYFLVIDGHCYIPTNKLLKNVVGCFEKSAADCLGRPQPLDPPGLSQFQKAVALARGSKLGHGGDSLIYGDYEGFASPVSNGAAYLRSVFERVGYVDESFDAAEDVEFNYRVEKAGLSCYTSPFLTVRYYPRENLRGLFRQMQRYGMGRFRFISKHREALSINQLIPAAFVIGLIALLIFVPCFLFTGYWTQTAPWFLFTGYWPLLAVLLSVVYGLYLLIVTFESIRIAARNGWIYLKHLPLIFFVIHFGLGLGFLKGLMSRRQKTVTVELTTKLNTVR